MAQLPVNDHPKAVIPGHSLRYSSSNAVEASGSGSGTASRWEPGSALVMGSLQGSAIATIT